MRGFQILNGDFSLNASGYFDTVSSSDKVARDVYKRLMTDKYWGNNPTQYFRYNASYGTTLNNSLLYANMSAKDAIVAINNAIGASLNDTVANQKQDTNLPMDEVIDIVDYFSAYDQTNKGVIKCNLKVKLLNGTTLNLNASQPVPSSGNYSLPGVAFQPAQ